MLRKGIVPLSLALIAGFGLVSCSSTPSSTTTTTGAGVSVSTSTTTTTKAPSGSTTEPTGTAKPGDTAATTVKITVGDTTGLTGPMTLTVAPASVKAGDVTFEVKNTGTIEHEVIVIKSDTAFDKLPIVDAGDPPAAVTTGANKVDEEASVGETGDPNLPAGETRSFTVTGMEAGKYVLVCNIADHYKMGMRAAFTVT